MPHPLLEHLTYVQDSPRLALYERALRATVRPDDIVLDLGCGTGILGLLAAQAGAAHVYSVDVSGIIEGARAVARELGLDDRITYLRGHSQDIELPVRATMLICDQLEGLGADAGLLRMTRDAQARHLSPDARSIPIRVETWVAPVSSPLHRARVASWNEAANGLSLRPFRTYAANAVYADAASGPTALAPPQRAWVSHLLSGAAPQAGMVGRVCWHCDAAGSLDGLQAFVVACLAPDLELTTSPWSGERIDRPSAFLPVDPPVPIAQGTTVTAEVFSVPETGPTSWTVSVEGQAGTHRRQHSTLQGAFLSREDLALRRPGVRPRVDDHGRARALILQWCDGTRTVDDLSTRLSEAMPASFADSAAAEAFVRRVLREHAPNLRS